MVKKQISWILALALGAQAFLYIPAMAAEAGAEIYTAGISETDTSALGVDTVGFGGEEPYIVEDLDAYETMEILTMDQEGTVSIYSCDSKEEVGRKIGELSQEEGISVIQPNYRYEDQALAVNDDGVLLALSSAERGTVFALDAGGESDTPFLSSSNTTSVGLWNSRRYRNGEALAVTAAGGTFYLLNRSRERVELWRFTPADGPAPGDAWKKLPDPPAESMAVAAWNRELFVLAAGRVWQLEGGKFVPFPTDIPVRHLAAAESGLCIAGEDRLIFLRANIRTGTFSPYREIPVANVTAVAAVGDRILISKPGALELYSAEDGSLEARLSVSD